jgi:transposase InsO family protein
MAISNRVATQELVFHSDRGVQYACDGFRKELKACPFICQSMSRRADCWDNAVAESFFKTLKSECVYGNRFEGRKAAAVEISQFVEIWYNRSMPHSSLGYRTPVQMEEMLASKPLAA